MQRQTQATLCLLFLSPVLAELVSGSSPPLEFFGPGLLALLALYGCGALLIRDAVIRWNKGWASLLLLGCAYGAYEEGLVTKSWFDPQWPDLGAQGLYGRAWGTNWVWAETLTIYHSVVSIALPIFLIDVLFPDFKGKRLLSDKGTKWALFFFLLVLPVFALGLPYWGGAEHLVALEAAGVFLAAALAAPRDLLRPIAAAAPRRAYPFALFGFLWMAFNFVFSSAASASGMPPVLALLLIGAAQPIALFALRGLLHPDNAERCLFAFLAGAFGFITLIGFFYGVFNPAGFGMIVVAPLSAVAFAWTYRSNLYRWAAAATARRFARASGRGA